METGLVAVIALLLLLGGTVGLLAKQGMLPWGPPALKALAATIPERRDDRLDRDNVPAPSAIGNGAEITPHTPPLAVVTTASVDEETAYGQDLARLEPLADRSAAVMARLERIEDRLHALASAIDRQTAAFSAETHRTTAELTSRLDAEEARREAALAQLRGDMLASMASMAGERPSGARDRHAEVSAELYARLARLEAALAAVTNPILLPGEPYVPPAEFMPEALVWENWNEVGERAFALADAFSAERLHLSAQTRAEFGLFVTALRTRLTGSIYPNLRPEPAAAQQAALRAALAEIAADLPRMRDALEREYLGGGRREAGGGRDTAGRTGGPTPDAR